MDRAPALGNAIEPPLHLRWERACVLGTGVSSQWTCKRGVSLWGTEGLSPRKWSAPALGNAIEPPLRLRWERAYVWEPARAANGRVNVASLRGELKGSSWELRFMDWVIKTVALHMGTARPAWPGS